MFDCFSERFLGILKKLKVYPVFWIFPSFVPTGCTGHVFTRNYIQTSSTLAWTLSGTFLDIFENFEVFPFFKVFSKSRPSRVHWRFSFWKKLPQNMFRTCLDTIGNSFGHFRIIEIFHFFPSFLFLTPQGALGKIFTGKMTSKHVQNMFDRFWERFLGILKNWKFFQFFEVFPSFDPPGCTRQNFFTERLPRSMFKTCLNLFENIFGHFEKKMKVFPSLDLPGCTGLFFRENYLKTSLDTFGKVFRDFQNLNSFRFLWNFFESPGCFGHSFFPSK